MDIFIWVLLSYGLMNIVVYGSIFRNFRNWVYLKGSDENQPFQGVFKFADGVLSCPLCFSTWGGFFLGAFVYSPTWMYLDVGLSFSWFFDGVFSAGCIWALNSIIEWYENKQ